MSDQSQQAARLETLLFAIRTRVEEGRRPVLRPSEAALLLRSASECADGARQAEVLSLFTALGGVELVEAALSDFE